MFAPVGEKGGLEGRKQLFSVSPSAEMFCSVSLSTGLGEQAQLRIFKAGKRNQNAECVARRRKDEERKVV